MRWCQRLLDWILKRIFTEKRVGSLIEKATPYIRDSIKPMVKDMVFDLMEDEDMSLAITTYGDALFERYKRKVWGTIGGLQKGVNAVTLAANPKLSFMDKDGNLSLGNIFRAAISGQLKGMIGGSQGSASSPSSVKVEIRSQ